MLNATRLQALNFVAAIVALVLLTVHMCIMHLDGLIALVDPDWLQPLQWARVVGRAAYSGSYVLFLAAVLYHGFYGLHTILTELWTSPRAGRWVTGGCVAAGAVLFVIGAGATIAFDYLYAPVPGGGTAP